MPFLIIRLNDFVNCDYHKIFANIVGIFIDTVTRLYKVN